MVILDFIVQPGELALFLESVVMGMGGRHCDSYSIMGASSHRLTLGHFIIR